ncbi:MAG: hypothetical protein ABEJ66_01125, partial [Candidatus Nanohaloarchaea archaeon]
LGSKFGGPKTVPIFDQTGSYDVLNRLWLDTLTDENRCFGQGLTDPVTPMLTVENAVTVDESLLDKIPPEAVALGIGVAGLTAALSLGS